jgi:23S rRNA pseudouridine1911/1915/1917 synthase
VHLAARGWPVVGDAVYGSAVEGFPRHALHAWRISLTHPASAARVDVTTTRVVDLSTHIGDLWPYRS